MSDLVTVVIPTIRPRQMLLNQAVYSARTQTVDGRSPLIQVQEDTEHLGAPATRHAGLMAVKTPWVAFLDDDDLFMPGHLQKLLDHAAATDADYVFSWFETIPGGCDPFPATHFTDPWDPDHPRQTTITTLVRTDLAQEVGFLRQEDVETGDGLPTGEDWLFTVECNRLGKISHLAERTWYWRHWGYGVAGKLGNTSGRGDRW